MTSPRYISKDGKNLRCRLCPHECLISDGRRGICGVRENAGGRASLPYYGMLSSIAVDPIEKKPLFHFYPGSDILSVGFLGCNFHCPFCQNFRISQEFAGSGEKKEPSELVGLAVKTRSFGIAYTYSEPVIHFEYIRETAQKARSDGLKNVLVSNGFLNTEPALELLPFLDAANIDLKSFSDDFYRKELGGSLEPVLKFISLAAGKVHLEITTLVIPGRNDSVEEIDAISRFLSSLDRDIPLHLSCYFPRYKYNERGTTYGDIKPLLAAAGKNLNFVYAGNIAEDADTLCPDCGNILVKRSRYRVSTPGLNNGKCSNCGRNIAVVR